MNGMVQHQEASEQEIKRHQQAARQWAEAGTLGLLSSALHDQRREHPSRTRFFAVASPMAVVLGILAIII